jgi:glutaredoxin
MRRVAHPLSIGLVVAGLLAPACSRDDDLPPPIPLPAAPAPESPLLRPSPHAPHTEPDPPKPWQIVPSTTASTTASATPSASPDPTAVPSVTPYAIPYPLPVPTLPALPQIPGLPAIPGLGSSAPVDPQGEAHVVIYGTRHCPACAKLKSDLGVRRVPYDFVDVEDPMQLNAPLGRVSADMPASMRNGIPVTRVTQRSGKTVWIQGCEPARIEKAYRG